MSCRMMHSTVVLALAVLMCPEIVPAADTQSSPESLLLKDFHPQSIYKTPETTVSKARFPAIDMHAHVYAKTPEQVAEWVRAMDEVGIQKSIVMTMATGKAFDEIQALYAKHPDRFEVWCGFDYTGYDKPGFGPAAVKELERCYKAGARGVGELGDKGKGLFYCKPQAWGMHLDDPRMDPLLEKCGTEDAGEHPHGRPLLDVLADGRQERRADERLHMAAGQSVGDRGTRRIDRDPRSGRRKAPHDDLRRLSLCQLLL